MSAPSPTPTGVTPPTPDQVKEIKSLSFKVGDKVLIAPVAPNTEVRKGVCKYIGTTKFADGLWVGVELVGAKGKNNGTVVGVTYFKCGPELGVFVRHELVTPEGGNIAGVTAQIAAAVKVNTLSAPPPTTALTPTSPTPTATPTTTATTASAPSATAAAPKTATTAPSSKLSSNSLLDQARKAAAGAKTVAPKVATKKEPVPDGTTTPGESKSLAATATATSEIAAAVAEATSSAAASRPATPPPQPATPAPQPAETQQVTPAEPTIIAATQPDVATPIEEPTTVTEEPQVNVVTHVDTPAAVISAPQPEELPTEVVEQKKEEAPAPTQKEPEIIPTPVVPVSVQDSAPPVVVEPKPIEQPPKEVVVAKPHPEEQPVKKEEARPPQPAKVTPPPTPPPPQFVPLHSDPKKTLSGKSELELLGDIEVLKDEVRELKEKVATLQEQSEGLEVDLELANEEKMIMQSDIEEMQIKVTIAEKRAASAAAGNASLSSPTNGPNDDEAAALMVQLQKSARSSQEENARLRKQLNDMKEHVAAMDSQANIIDNLTERNLELSDEMEGLRKGVKDLTAENEDLKQLQFMLDEELNLQREQSDGFAAHIKELQARLASAGADAGTSQGKMELKNKNLEDEIRKLQVAIREHSLKNLHSDLSKATERHTTDVTAAHVESLIAKQDSSRRGMISRAGTTGAQTSLLAKVRADELIIVSPEGTTDDNGVASSSASSAPRSEAVAKSLTEVFVHVQDATNLAAVMNECDAIIGTMGTAMAAIDGAVRLITKAWRTLAATAASEEASQSLISSYDMTLLDAAVAHVTLYVEIQQVVAALVSPTYRKQLQSYCRAHRDSFNASSATGSSSGHQNGNILRVLEALHSHLTFISSAAALQTHASAGHYGLASSQLQSRLDDIATAIGVIHKEVSNFYASVTSNGADGKEIKGFGAAIEAASSAASWWTMCPNGGKAQSALAMLNQSLILAAIFGSEQTKRTLTSTVLRDYVVINAPEKPEVNEDGTTDGPKPPTIVDVAGKVNATLAADALADTIKLLERAEGQIKDNFVLFAMGGEEGGSAAADESATTSPFNLKASLRFGASEGSMALLLIFRSLMTFSAMLRTAEADTKLGLVSEVGSAFVHYLVSSNNHRLQFLTDSTRFLSNVNGDDASTTANRSAPNEADSAAVMTNDWKPSKSLAIAHLCTVYGTSLRGSNSNYRPSGPDSEVHPRAYLVTPLLRSIVGATSSRDGAKGKGYDDLKNSSTATLASLFVQGGIRKDVNAFASSAEANAVKSPTEASSPITEAISIRSRISASVRKDMLAAMAKASAEIFAGLGGEGDSSSEGSGGGKGSAAEVHKLTKALEERMNANGVLSAKVQEMELQLWEAQSDRNVVQLMQKEVEAMRAGIHKSEAHHKLELEQQSREWTEAFDQVNKDKQGLRRELNLLKTEEKLSPMSALERRQHNLLIAYYSSMVGELLMGGVGMPAPIGLRSDNGSPKADLADLIQGQRGSLHDDEVAELCGMTVSPEAPIVIGPTLPTEASLSATRSHPGEVQSVDIPTHSRMNPTFLSTSDADRLLRFLRRKPVAFPAAADGEADQPALSAAEQAHQQRLEQKQNQVTANRKKHSGSTLYLTSLPKIRRFTSQEECREARLGVLLSTQ